MPAVIENVKRNTRRLWYGHAPPSKVIIKTNIVFQFKDSVLFTVLYLIYLRGNGIHFI